MTHVALFGLGLIGGSLGKALRGVKRGGRRVYRVSGTDRSASTRRTALKIGAVDAVIANDLSKIDVVVLCVPVQHILPVARRLIPKMRKGSVLTDVGSVKDPIFKQLDGAARRAGVTFVGGHPLAGSERFGVKNAEARLFRGSACFLTARRASAGVKIVQRLWKDVGATPRVISSSVHDRWLALTSHLPHLLSFSLFSLASQAARREPGLKLAAAGSFRDMTRIAASQGEMWSGIVSLNRRELKKVEKEFSKTLRRLLLASPASLQKTLTALSRAKQKW